MGDYTKIMVEETKMKEKTRISDFMSLVIDIQVYDLKNSQNSQLMCFHLNKINKNSNSFVIFCCNNN